jgi:hypothetical protein
MGVVFVSRGLSSFRPQYTRHTALRTTSHYALFSNLDPPFTFSRCSQPSLQCRAPSPIDYTSLIISHHVSGLFGVLLYHFPTFFGVQWQPEPIHPSTLVFCGGGVLSSAVVSEIILFHHRLLLFSSSPSCPLPFASLHSLEVFLRFSHLPALCSAVSAV